MEKTISTAGLEPADTQEVRAAMTERAALRAEYNRRAMELNDKFGYMFDSEKDKHRRLVEGIRRRWAEAKENMRRENEQEMHRHAVRCEELCRERARARFCLENERQEAFARIGIARTDNLCTERASNQLT